MSRGWSSPWDGGNRRVLGLVLAAVVGWDLLSLVDELVIDPGHALPHPGAPRWLSTLAGSPVAVLALAVLGAIAAVAYARDRRPLGAGALALVCSGVLVEAAAAHGAGPYRARFFVGAMLLGALLGRVWSRIVGDGDEARAAEAGAVAMLAATYVGAATSKLGGAGLAWADATTLRAVALAHAPVDGASPATWLAHAPGVARGFAIATVIVQLGALAYPWSARTRTIAGVGLVGFHVGVATFASIGYWEPVVLLLAFSLPWPRWIPRLRAPPVPTLADRDPWSSALAAANRRANMVIGAIVLAIVAVAWLVPWRRYTELHHRPRGLEGGDSQPREPLERFGPLALGDRLAGGWRIDALAREPTRAMVVLRHDTRRRAVLWISAVPPAEAKAGAERPSPFDTSNVRVAYEGRDASEFTAAARELSARLDAAATSPDAVAAWLRGA